MSPEAVLGEDMDRGCQSLFLNESPIWVGSRTLQFFGISYLCWFHIHYVAEDDLITKPKDLS